MARTSSIFGLRTVCLIAIALCAIFQLTISEQKFCGKAMNDALTLMCGVRGYNTYKTKRSSPLDEIIDGDEDESLGFDLDQLPYWSSMSANTLARLRRRREGIYHECCFKPCSRGELMTYCIP